MPSPLQPPRVGHVITGLRTGGAELALLRLVTASPEARRRVLVVSLTPGGPVRDQLEEAGVHVVDAGMRSLRDLPRALLLVRRALRTHRAEVVQTWMHHADLVGGLAGASLRIPVVWGLRMGPLTEARERAATRAVARVNAAAAGVLPKAVVACSYAVADAFIRSGFPAQKMVVVPNGYDTDRPVPTTSLRDELRLPADALVVGRIGRWHSWKDHPRFLKAMAPLLATDPRLHVVLVGEDLDPANPALAELVAGLPAPERVHRLGRRDDMDAVYGTLDVLCSSSSGGEGFPNVIAEAMLAAVPIVTTDVGESARIVGATGEVVPPADTGALRAALQRLLALSPEERQARGVEARQSIQDRYSLAKMVAGFDDVHARLARP